MNDNEETNNLSAKNLKWSADNLNKGFLEDVSNSLSTINTKTKVRENSSEVFNNSQQRSEASEEDLKQKSKEDNEPNKSKSDDKKIANQSFWS